MDRSEYKDNSTNIIKRYFDIRDCIDTESIVVKIDKLY